MKAHTHNPPDGHGRFELEGQQKPQALLDALDGAAGAWKSHDIIVDEEADPELIAFALSFAKTCDYLVDREYERWHQASCPHTDTFTHTVGEQYMSQGEPDDNIEEQELCSTCFKEIG